MAPPILKIIELLTDKKASLFAYLSEQNFNERPIFISLKKFPEKQFELIEMLDEYFTQRNFLYEVYVQTDLVNYPSSLNLVKSIEEVPRFFKHKAKQLNLKENAVFNKIKLKQEQLKNINQNDVLPILKDYAFRHKEIKSKNDFLNYTKNIIQSIRNKDVT
jgi:hypothetical protein